MIQPVNFRKKLFAWAVQNPRDYPWIGEKNPYKIWISEIMLQQTRSEQALPFYNKFLDRFPTLSSFAQAEEDEVLKYWQGLGYYSRARNAQATAKLLLEKFNATFPEEADQLIKLKGIGSYTAAAISSFAFNKPAAVIDGNVIRVFSRLMGLKINRNNSISNKKLEALAQTYLDKSKPGKYNQALMNFGATCCTPKNPLCANCAYARQCFAFQNDAIAEYPAKMEKKPLRIRYFHFFYLLNDAGTIAVLKRTKKDIWKGLYQLPHIETETDLILTQIASKKLTQILQIKAIPKSFQYTLALHSKLTHQDLKCHFYLMRSKAYSQKIKNSITFVEEDKLENFAFPIVISRFFSYLKKNSYVK